MILKIYIRTTAVKNNMITCAKCMTAALVHEPDCNYRRTGDPGRPTPPAVRPSGRIAVRGSGRGRCGTSWPKNRCRHGRRLHDEQRWQMATVRWSAIRPTTERNSDKKRAGNERKGRETDLDGRTNKIAYISGTTYDMQSTRRA